MTPPCTRAIGVPNLTGRGIGHVTRHPPVADGRCCRQRRYRALCAPYGASGTRYVSMRGLI
eukprot:3495758-Prymnesium_polylepis.1